MSTSIDEYKSIEIPEIDQSIIDSIKLDENGQISNANEIININDEELERAFNQLTQEEKEQIFREANESITSEEIDEQALNEDLTEFIADFDKQKDEIENRIKQQKDNIKTLGDLFNKVTKAKNDFDEIRQTEIDKIKKNKNEISQQIEDIENQIRNALSEKEVLKEYESNDVSSLEKTPKGFEDTIIKQKKEIKRMHTYIQELIPDLYKLVKKDAPKIDKNDDTNVIDSLNQIKESIEEIINSMID